MQDLTAARVRELLHYDPDTGVLTRAAPSKGCRVGDVAGRIRKDGYRELRVCGRPYPAHRIAWLHANGEWPKKNIDHINGIRDDNRLCNLREADFSENGQNQRRAQSDNRSARLLGVSWHKRNRRYEASITVCGRRRYLGGYVTPEEAHAAYLKAKRELHPFSTI